MSDAPITAPSPARSRRSWIRIIGLPIVVLTFAWVLQSRAVQNRSAVLEQLHRDARAFVRAVVDDGVIPGIGGVPVPRASSPGVLAEAAPGVRLAATSALEAAGDELRSAGWLVTVSAGDDGPGPRGAATHTATVAAGERPVVHLRLAIDGSRTVLCGHWLSVR